jgi:chromosome transmission fidelity protein 18
VLESEWKRESASIDMEARRRRGGQNDEDTAPQDTAEAIDEAKAAEANKRAVKRDFFGRVIKHIPIIKGQETKKQKEDRRGDANRIWVSFHEGFSNAVKKPITIDDLLRGL